MSEGPAKQFSAGLCVTEGVITYHIYKKKTFSLILLYIHIKVNCTQGMSPLPSIHPERLLPFKMQNTEFSRMHLIVRASYLFFIYFLQI
ncbi:hypothetical protein FKM82_010223 [Ascaphus truei]